MTRPAIRPVFEENRGQAPADVLFQSRDRRGMLQITRSGARMILTQKTDGGKVITDEVHLLFSGSHWRTAEGESPLPSRSHVITGNDPSRWKRDLRHYGAVRVREAYPGIDVVFHARKGYVEFDLELAPGASPDRIRLQFPKRQAHLAPTGELRIATRAGDAVLAKPVSFQEGPSGQQVLTHFHRLPSGEFGFRLGNYDRDRRLIIDPAIAYMTYWGGNAADVGYALAVDGAGNMYLAGTTLSPNFPVSRTPAQATPAGGTDIFIAKFSPSGSLIYSTLIGGRDSDRVNDIAVDTQGSVYFCGASASANFPLVGAIQSTNRGGSTGLDAVFGKLNPAGSALVYSSFYGGNFTDEAYACAVDADNAFYMAGRTVSDNFPFTPGAFQTSNRSPIAGNGFVTKINPAGDAAVFSTFLGGNTDDGFYDLVLDRSRNIYVTGRSFSTNYPVVGAFQPNTRGSYDAVLSKLSATGSALLFSTYVGGSAMDVAYGIALDSEENIYIMGLTEGNFPLPANALRRDVLGPNDTFVVKFDNPATTMQYGTLLGGNREDEPFALAVDRQGAAYIFGTTASTGIQPVDAVQPNPGGNRDAFLFKLAPRGDAVQMMTYFGGAADDLGIAMTLDNTGRIYIAGLTGSTTLIPSTGAPQNAAGGVGDAYLAVIDTSPAANRITVSSTRLTFAATPGTPAPQQQIQIRATAGAPQWTVDATTTRGGQWLTATPRSGTGSATVDVAVNTTGLTSGTYEGSLTVSNTRLNERTVVAVTMTLGEPAATVSDSGIVSAATFTGGAISPGMVVTIFGSRLGPATLTTAQLTPQGTLATTLAETRVLFDGNPAPLVYVSAGQVSAVAPYRLSGTAQVAVEFRGVRSNAVPIRVVDTAPGLFTANSSGRGQAAALNEDGSFNSPSVPARTNGVVVLYGTGEGATDPDGQDGVLATGSTLPRPRQPVTVRIGGKEAEVLYAGAAPGLVAGVFQINVRVPADAGSGDVPVVVQIGAASSPSGVTIAVAP